MEKVKIKIGDNSYTVKVAYTDEEKEEGLQNVKELPNDEGMLFVFDEDGEEVSMWMKDTLISLNIIFIGPDLKVKDVYVGVPKSEVLLTMTDTAFVLEVNDGSLENIRRGEDELEFSPNVKGKMQILDENGDCQMELDGGERIFSRTNTKTLIKFAKKAAATNKDSDFKSLGKRVFSYIKTQDSNPEEFVEKRN